VELGAASSFGSRALKLSDGFLAKSICAPVLVDAVDAVDVESDVFSSLSELQDATNSDSARMHIMRYTPFTAGTFILFFIKNSFQKFFC